MKTILFNGHDLKFLTHIIEHFKNKNDVFNVLIDEFPGHEISDKARSASLLKQADLIFCEWALGNADWYSHHKKPHQRLVIRLHHQEIGLKFLHNINYANVDKIIFICQENMNAFLKRFPHLSKIATLIYNVIDCDILDKPKLPYADFNLGFIGLSPMRKAPHHSFNLFKELRISDSRYTLFFKGKHPWEYPWLWNRINEKVYYQKFYQSISEYKYSNSIVFDPHGNDIPNWFQKIGFILSTSDHEGSHQSIAEGMATGALPIIRNWNGADKLYPPEFVVDSVQEAIRLMNRFREPALYADKVKLVKEYTRNHFDVPVITSKYETLFNKLLGIKPLIPYQHNKIVAKNSDLRVLFVCYLKPGNQSGYEVRVIEEAKTLVQQGVHIYIAVFVSSDYANSKNLLETYQKHLKSLTGASVFAIPTRHFFDMAESDSMKEEIDAKLMELAKKYSIPMIHGQALYATIHALRAGKKAGLKVVFDVHGVSPEETQMTGGSIARIKMLTSFERKALTQADLKVLVSDRMKQYFFDKYSLNTEPSQLIPCCVKHELFSINPERRSMIRKNKGFEDKFVIVYLGTLSAWQWPEAMFNLFKKFNAVFKKSIFYLLIPEYDQPKAKILIQKYNLPKKSYLLEEVPHAKVGQVLGVADAGLLLREENPVNFVSSPTKFGEYLAAGLPVILTENIGDYSEFTINHKAGISIDINNKSISANELDKLVAFASDVMRNRHAWSDLCSAKAAEYLNWQSYGKLLLEKYQMLLNNK